MPSVGKKATSAVMMVRMPHAGCQCSGWCAEMERQIFLPTWKRPFGVRNTMFGGFIGYSAGSRIRPWYTPPSKSVPGGPRSVKCHSNMLSSSGSATYWSDGFVVISRMSALIRLTACDMSSLARRGGCRDVRKRSRVRPDPA